MGFAQSSTHPTVEIGAIVNNNESQPTTNNRGYDRPLTKAPGRVRTAGRNSSVSISRIF
jgi:hypothetical protein